MITADFKENRIHFTEVIGASNHFMIPLYV
jgi:hypothetical protein